jgi:hypothetical protein
VQIGRFSITLVNEILQRVQRVKQKMGIQLRTNGFQFGFQLLSDHHLLPVLQPGAHDKYQRKQ